MTLPAKPTASATPDDLVAIHAQYSRGGIFQRRIRHGTLAAAWRVALWISACGKRFSDILLSSLILLVLSPLFIAIALGLSLNKCPLFKSESRVGRWSVPFLMVQFNTSQRWGGLLRRVGLDRLPVLINVLRGEMSLVGPRAVAVEEMDTRQRAARKRSSVRPGLLSLWWLRKKANINFGSELDVDLEYIDGQTVSGDIGIALRAIPSVFYGASPAAAPARVDVLGIPVDNLTMEEALQNILDAAGGQVVRQLCFVNTDCVNKSIHDESYKQLLCKSDLTLADGIGIRLAGKITRTEVRQNVNGTDLFPLLCQRLQGSELGFFFLGARPEVVVAFADWVTKSYPGVRIKGHRDGYFKPSEEEAILTEIRDSGAEILLVAFGSPRQDLWIGKHLQKLGKVRIAMGVGGLLDFYSGRIPRAPQWMRELSLEWAYRLYQEPRRMWRRYLVGNLVFLWRVILSTIFHRFKTYSVEE